jgi:cell envelope-related transcriptional attenuator
VLVFGAIFAIKAVGNMQLSNNDEYKTFRQITDIFGDNSETPKTPEKRGSKNILIAGIGGRGHPGGELTDSLMLANMNYDTKTVTLLSIPRDLYVAYSSNSAGKINALYPMGQKQNEGVNLLAKKVSEITNQPIHHYLIIDFSGFKSIVDALGGVEVNVPKKIYDREYPNNNWGYEIFSLNAGLQTLDGKTALKFARSRHSTSDFDRSSRQQLLLKAIKDKALSLGILTNPAKISELIDSVRNNLSTDLTVGDLVDIGLAFKDMSNTNILMYSYNNECNGICMPGSYLYTPGRDDFGGAWVLLPENATRSRVSRYENMRQFASLVFEFPHLQNAEKSIRIVTNSKNLSQAKNIRKNLEQLGFPIDHQNAIVQTGATIETTNIHKYYDSAIGTGFDDNHILVEALKKIEPSISQSTGTGAKFATGTGQYIEIILGNDAKNYFQFKGISASMTENNNFSESNKK